MTETYTFHHGNELIETKSFTVASGDTMQAVDDETDEPFAIDMPWFDGPAMRRAIIAHRNQIAETLGVEYGDIVIRDDKGRIQ